MVNIRKVVWLNIATLASGAATVILIGIGIGQAKPIATILTAHLVVSFGVAVGLIGILVRRQKEVCVGRVDAAYRLLWGALASGVVISSVFAGRKTWWEWESVGDLHLRSLVFHLWVSIAASALALCLAALAYERILEYRRRERNGQANQTDGNQ